MNTEVFIRSGVKFGREVCILIVFSENVSDYCWNKIIFKKDERSRRKEKNRGN